MLVFQEAFGNGLITDQHRPTAYFSLVLLAVVHSFYQISYCKLFGPVPIVVFSVQRQAH